jgi:hypothetical protein
VPAVGTGLPRSRGPAGHRSVRRGRAPKAALVRIACL